MICSSTRCHQILQTGKNHKPQRATKTENPNAPILKSTVDTLNLINFSFRYRKIEPYASLEEHTFVLIV